jgi:glycosyltransferase involved in cell wall biosynthesis
MDPRLGIARRSVDISVVIPTYNNRDVLARTLASVLAQEFRPDRYEVIVLDDGSTDGTDEMMRTIAGPAPIVYRRQENRGRAAARNAGSRLAQGRTILYLDSDIIAQPDLLSRHHARHAASPAPIGVQGRTLVHPRSKTTAYMKTKELLPDLTVRRRTNLSPYHVITRNLSIRAEDLWAVGGFDESFPGYGWEDIELGLRLQSRGVRFVYEPDALGYHDEVETLERTREKLRQAGEGAVYFWTKHGRRTGLGLFLEIHPALLPLKWLVYRTGGIGGVVRRTLPWAEQDERLWICSECYNYLLWEAYYQGVFGALRAERAA